MSRRLLVFATLTLSMPALGEPEVPTVPTEAQQKAAATAFATVATVLRHPRCMNCHPAGDAPLQGDQSTPHRMSITRNSPNIGLPCSTCHRSTGLDGPNLPPAVDHWQLPPANQVFEGRTDQQLCAQLNDPTTTGGRDHTALLEHVSHDALVLYGWTPGGGRTTPTVSHSAFVAAFTTWVEGGGACPP